MDPQADLSTCLGFNRTDVLDVTVAEMMTRAINEEKFDWRDGLLESKDGIYLLPSNLDLSAMEMNLVGTMNRERVLKGYVDKVKNNFDFVIIDCMPSLGMITINALSAAESAFIVIIPSDGMQSMMTKSKLFFTLST